MSDSETNVDYLLRKLERLMKEIKYKLDKYQQKINADFCEENVIIYSQGLEKIWQKFEQTSEQMERLVAKEEQENIAYYSEEWFELANEWADEVRVMVQKSLNKIRKIEPHKLKSETLEKRQKTKLPSIDIPTFSGNYDDWQSYHDLFKSLVHNNEDVDNVRKMQHLKTSLKGEAAKIIKELSITDENYVKAWELITARYNNKRYIANEILKKIMHQKVMQVESANGLKEILDVTTAGMSSFTNLGMQKSLGEYIISYLVAEKLDGETRKAWEIQFEQIKGQELPSWNQLSEFLTSRYKVLEMADKGIAKKFNDKINNVHKQKMYHTSMEYKKVCFKCGGEHKLFRCDQYLRLQPDQRRNLITALNLCHVCLDRHKSNTCLSKYNCSICQRRHNTTLHMPLPTSKREVYKESSMQDQDRIKKTFNQQKLRNNEQCQSSNQDVIRINSHFAIQDKNHKILLATAMARIKTENSGYYPVRVLIDPGSEASFVAEHVVQALNLTRKRIRGSVSGVSNEEMQVKYMVEVPLEGYEGSMFKKLIPAYVLSSLNSELPSRSVTINDWQELGKIKLADPRFGTTRAIDLILGVDQYAALIQPEMIRHPRRKDLIACKTRLGWVLSGKIGEDKLKSRRLISLHLQLKEDELLRSFWETEREPNIVVKKFTKEEKLCEDMYDKTTTRNKDGRYEVKLPFKKSCLLNEPNDSKQIAFKCLNNLEKKLSRNPDLQKEYNDTILDYLQQGHLEIIKSEKEKNEVGAIYLPHHAVIKTDKLTSKVRVVFNASSRNNNGLSLNDMLLPGPNIQTDLRHLLTRWRQPQFCLIADIRQMYRQVLVKKTDKKYQRILWREDPSKKINHYQLTRLTFGTSAAPYLAIKTLRQVAKDEGLDTEPFKEIVLNDFYMDDLLTGCEKELDLERIYEGVSQLLLKGGFQIHKWSSNSKSFIRKLSSSIAATKNEFTFHQNKSIKVLGVRWDRDEDAFKYNYTLPPITNSLTKRKALSQVASLYDPLGWISPVIIKAKLFMRDIWKSKILWDQELSNSLQHQWSSLRFDLLNLEQICIPRWFGTVLGDRRQLHVFADASRDAYAAVVYLKVISASGKIKISLIAAKTRVAPIERELTIPRLELNAACLSAKLLKETAQILQIKREEMFAWSDSKVALAWIQAEASRWSPFISNRVSIIKNIIYDDHWNYIESQNNPADCASRGISVQKLIDHKLWWAGPTCLIERNCYINKEGFVTKEEERKIKLMNTVILPQRNFEWDKFSGLNIALRIMSYVFRFLQGIKLDRKFNSGVLISCQERLVTLHRCIKVVQKAYFKEEYKQIQAGRDSVARKSELWHLNPFIDEEGLLRVGGRTQKACLPYNQIHPIILPTSVHLTNLIIEDAHRITLHGGPQLMLNYLRNKYWIIQGRRLVRKAYRNCVTCIRYSQHANYPKLGQLPEVRLKPKKPFIASGVDLCGPFTIKFSSGRGSKLIKAYICLFICMVTKAVHLEVVSDMTTDTFLAAFKRFISRRGRCNQLFSDNGTNFVGANNKLKENIVKLKKKLPNEFSHQLSEMGIDWHFIPPRSPHFGGLWEAGIKSSKYHLKRILKNLTLTYEEFSTVLAQVEACLNSRPLSDISDHPGDDLPLTPAHFLVGESLLLPFEENLEESSISNLRRWRLTQKLVQHFWKRWSKEYLASLNAAYKWHKNQLEPQIDDLVILREENLPPAKWLMGRILEKHPGKDNISRVFSVKTKDGIFVRSYNKLCFLPK